MNDFCTITFPLQVAGYFRSLNFIYGHVLLVSGDLVLAAVN